MKNEKDEEVEMRIYVDMMEEGFKRVGEFNYINNDWEGKNYENI